MTKERIEKELSKVDAQLESLQAKKKDLAGNEEKVIS